MQNEIYDEKNGLTYMYVVIIICQNWHLQISNQLMGNMGCFVKAIYRNTERQNIKYCCYKENLSSI